MSVNRRLTPRFSIVLVAELTETPGGSPLHGRTSDVSRTGCYVDALHAFTPGTRICVNLRRGNENFEVFGKVVHATPEFGMGIVFDQPVRPGQLLVLDRWIAEVMVTTI